MIQECPHCYVRMFPSAAGVCPSCNKNIHDCTDAAPDLTRVDISPLDILPGNCLECDRPTTRRVKVKRSKVEGNGDHPLLTALLSLILLPFGWIRIGSSGQRYSLSMKILVPQCDGCASSGIPEPEYVDFEEGRMSFVVHKHFRERVRSMKESSARSA